MRGSWNDRSVLVTGATGMIGSSVVTELLGLGANVVCLVLDADPRSELLRSGNINRASVVNGDLTDFWTVERAVNEHEVDTIIHLGAQTIVGTAHRFPLPTLEANIRGTYNVLESARLHGDIVKRVVVASSDKAYGDQLDLPYTEETPLGAQFPYDVSKSTSDLICQSYCKTYSMKVGIIRCGNIYGPGDFNLKRLIPEVILSTIEKKNFIIRSDGKSTRDYVYVDDVADAYLKLFKKIKNSKDKLKIYNVSSKFNYSVLEIVNMILNL